MKTEKFKFYKSIPYEKRKHESERIIAKYPDRIPIICEKSNNDKSMINIDKNKYLVPNDLTVGQFVYVIRKRIKLNPETAIYLFINNKLHNSSALLSNVYQHNKNKDGFLYVTYSGENSFGFLLSN